MYILFYSNKCTYCESLINILKSKGLIKEFKTISVDNNTNLPSYLTKVPTLIVPNVNKPLEGKNAFMWVNTIFSFNQETNNFNNKINNNQTFNDNKKGPGGFTKEEMGGISDSFSFVSDKNDDKMKKNYNYLEDKEEDEIDIPRVILTNDNQQEQLNNMLEERKKQDREFVENDEVDDLVDVAYNGVQSSNRAIIHGDINRPEIITKKQSGLTQKKNKHRNERL